MAARGFRRRIADEVIEGPQGGGGTGAHGDDDLLERHSGGIPCGIDAGQGGGALGVDLDLAKAGQGHLAPFQELGVRYQTYLHEDAGHRQVLDLTSSAILVVHAHHLAAVTDHFGGAGAHDDVDVAHGASLLLQHLVGAQGIGELHHGDVLDDASQIDGRLDTGVAAPDHRDPLALEEGAVTVRAVGHALGAVLELARHVQVAPAGTGRQDHGAALQGGTGGEVHVDVTILADGGGALLGDHFHAVLLDVLLQARGQLGALGVGH